MPKSYTSKNQRIDCNKCGISKFINSFPIVPPINIMIRKRYMDFKCNFLHNYTVLKKVHTLPTK